MRQNLTKLDTVARTQRHLAAQKRQAVQKAAFLAAFALCPAGRWAVALAATAAGVHRATPYRWRASDAHFAAQWAQLEREHWAALHAQVRAETAAREAAREQRNAALRPQRRRIALQNLEKRRRYS